MCVCAAAWLGVVHAPAQPVWQVVTLPQGGFTHPDVAGAAGMIQTGTARLNEVRHPVYWRGGAGPCLSLLPASGWSEGHARGTDELWIAGDLTPDTFRLVFPILWHRSEGVHNLNEDGGLWAAYATDVASMRAVGAFYDPNTGDSHAALWTGPEWRVTDLHPSVGLWSEAVATDGRYQGGRVDMRAQGVAIHAALWEGSAASFVDLHPPHNPYESAVRGMAPGVQVGTTGIGPLAALWRGTSASYRNLHPEGANNSWLWATTGRVHVGFAYINGSAHAGVWFGDDGSSFTDIHGALGPDWTLSEATAVAVHRGQLLVSGSARRRGNRISEAVLWYRPYHAAGDASGHVPP